MSLERKSTNGPNLLISFTQKRNSSSWEEGTFGNASPQSEIIGCFAPPSIINVICFLKTEEKMHNLSISQCFLSPRMAFHAVIDEEPSSISRSPSALFPTWGKMSVWFNQKSAGKKDWLLLINYFRLERIYRWIVDGDFRRWCWINWDPIQS